MSDLERYKKELELKRQNLEDVTENFKYLLEHQDIRDINILSFHYEIRNLLNNIEYLESIIFNMEF